MGTNAISVFRGAGIIAALVLIVFVIFGINSIGEDVPADTIVICQMPFTGTLKFWTEPGWQYQGFGTTYPYEKAYQYYFTSDSSRGENKNQSQQIIFNDAGRASLSGSARILLPRDVMHLRMLQTDFGSMEAVKEELIGETIKKVLFATGPLMSSFESYATKKNDLIQYITDQLENGVYKTSSEDRKVRDELSGELKTISVASIVPDPNAPGGYARQEKAPFQEYGLKVTNLTLDNIIYDGRVMKQIDLQQDANMRVKTAIAQSKEAEQEAIRVEAKGKADAAVAKWEQEKVNAKEIAEAEKKVRVAQLEKEAASLTKQKDILLGEGESTRRKLILAADGALEKKLDAWLEAQRVYANMISNYKGAWVPQTYIGGGDGKNQGVPNGAETWMTIMGMKAAKELNLDMSVQK